MNDSTYLAANLWRRMAAIVYDGLLIVAVILVAFLPTIPFSHGLEGPTGITQTILQIYLFSVIFLFLGWFWTHGGQTLGMRAWKIKLLQRDGYPVPWHLAFFYYLVSLPMWGFLIFTIAVNAGMIPTPGFLVNAPHWILYSLVLIWFVIDHLPNNWREKVSGLRMVVVS